MNIENEYKLMVTKLTKSGVHIAYSLNGSKANLWHMATGLAGEAGEVLKLGKDFKKTHNLNYGHLIDELGDVNFYLTGLIRSHFDGVDFPDLTLRTHCPNSLIDLCVDLSIYANDTLDLVKKLVIHSKDKPEQLKEAVTELHLTMRDLYSALGVTHEHVLEANMNKLLKGKNARYGSGVYSDEQAQNRADEK